MSDIVTAAQWEAQPLEWKIIDLAERREGYSAEEIADIVGTSYKKVTETLGKHYGDESKENPKADPIISVGDKFIVDTQEGKRNAEIIEYIDEWNVTVRYSYDGREWTAPAHVNYIIGRYKNTWKPVNKFPARRKAGNPDKIKHFGDPIGEKVSRLTGPKKKNPRPPIWENKTFIATRGIAGKIYFGYKERPPQTFKTKKALRESGAKIYKAFSTFLKKYNLKADVNLSEQRKYAYNLGGWKKLIALEKRNSNLPKPKAPTKTNPATAENPKARQLSDRELQKAIDVYTKFHGHEPDKIKVIRLKGRPVLVWVGKGKNITYQVKKQDDDKIYNHSHDIENHSDVYWDIANNGFFVKGKYLDITKYGIEG